MTIARMFCFASVLAVATVIGTNAPSYGARSCCNWVDGKYINSKTGKEVKPPKGAVAPLDGGVTQEKTKPATPANPYYRLADPYYGYSDPYRGFYDYYAVPPVTPGYTYGYVRPRGWR
jgi:hypothetical protein